MILLELTLTLDAKLLKQDLPHSADAVALVVLPFGLLDDAVGVHAGKLDRDCRVGLFADANLTDTCRPGPASP